MLFISVLAGTNISSASVFSLFFFFKQKTAYEMRISDWSSDVCSSDLDVAIISSREQYGFLEELLNKQQGALSLEQRKDLARQAFYVSSHYDTSIFEYFNREEPSLPVFKQSLQVSQSLRYGENPHQKGTLDRTSTRLHSSHKCA